MSPSRVLAIAVVLAAASVTPAAAQAVISEPGYCAFFYPSANCQNKGPGNPYSDPNFHSYQGGVGTWLNGETPVVTPRRPRHRATSGRKSA
jgi:hypothetical protein